MMAVRADRIWPGKEYVHSFGYFESGLRFIPFFPVLEAVLGAYYQNVAGIFGVYQSLTGYISPASHCLISKLPDYGKDTLIISGVSCLVLNNNPYHSYLLRQQGIIPIAGYMAQV